MDNVYKEGRERVPARLYTFTVNVYILIKASFVMYHAILIVSSIFNYCALPDIVCEIVFFTSSNLHLCTLFASYSDIPHPQMNTFAF